MTLHCCLKMFDLTTQELSPLQTYPHHSCLTLKGQHQKTTGSSCLFSAHPSSVLPPLSSTWTQDLGARFCQGRPLCSGHPSSTHEEGLSWVCLGSPQWALDSRLLSTNVAPISLQSGQPGGDSQQCELSPGSGCLMWGVGQVLAL